MLGSTIHTTVTQGDAASDARGSETSSDIDSGSESTDYCVALPPLASPAVIDGTLDPGLRLAALSPSAWVGLDGGAPAEIAAVYAVAWRSDGLYFFVSVTDKSRSSTPLQTPLYCNPGVELYADDDGSYAAPPKYDDPGSNHFIVAAPQNDTTPLTAAVWGRGAAPTLTPWTSPRFGAFATPTGYVVEAMVGAEDLGLTSWTLTAASRVGLDVGVNVGRGSRASSGDPACPDRIGQFVLRTTPQQCTFDCNFPWRTVEAFCNTALKP